MRVNFDKNGLIYAAKSAVLGGIIIFAGISISQKLIIPFLTRIQPQQGASEEEPPEAADENAFYIDLPGEKPFFLPATEIVQKKETLVWEKKDFIYADLPAMTLKVYEGGAEQKAFKILSRPKTGGFFETPSGFYKIQGKLENHISKIEGIRLPWSVYLYGNYLINGVPVLKNGRKAADDLEGGGIRLTDKDAKELFSIIKENTSVLVYSETSEPVNFLYFRRTALPHKVPEVSSASALAVDLETGKTLFEKNTTDVYPIASITKLMTALVATENVEDEKKLTVTKEALATYGDSAALITGEEIRSRDLLFALLLPSSNDAAEIYRLSADNFIELMNEKARTIGLSNTFFADPSGLSRENVSSVEDLAKLLKYLDKSASRVLEISRTPNYSYRSENKKVLHNWRNISWPADDKRFFGGKSGFTDNSLQTIAGIYNVRVSEYGGRKLAVIVLGSRNRTTDVRAIINYIENEFIYGASLAETKQGRIQYGAAIYEALK